MTTFNPDLSINVAPLLLNHIQSLLLRNASTSPFCIGGIVTAIAHYLNLQDRLQQLPYWQAQFLDIEYCQYSHIIKERRDERYNLMVQNKAIPGIILLNSAITRFTSCKLAL